MARRSSNKTKTTASISSELAAKIEEEALAVTKLEQTDEEDRSEFLARISRVLAELPDSRWKKMSEFLQIWSNKAWDVDPELDEVPDFDQVDYSAASPAALEAAGVDNGEDETDGDDADPDPEVSEDDAAAAEQESKPMTTKSKSAKKKAAAKATPKAAAKKAARRPLPAEAVKKARGTAAMGAMAQIKAIVAKNPEISNEDLIAEVGKKGIETTETAIKSCRYECVHTMNVLRQLGMLG